MDIKAEQKYLLISPKKVRVVVAMIKRLKPSLAVENLSLVGKSAAEPLRKVILQALANARVKGISEDTLSFKEIQIGEGPRLKRGQPVSRGQWHPIKKRMSHIRVVLTTPNKQITNDKSQINSKSENKQIKDTNIKETVSK